MVKNKKRANPKKSNQKIKKTKNFNMLWIIVFVSLLLLTLSFITRYQGSIDVKDYTDTAKFFAGEYNAKLRTAHSLVYGLIHAPIVKLTHSFIIFKITSVLWLSLTILSLYFISKKDKKTLLLFVLSPVLWFMAPYINSIQLATLLFLWGYFFIKKYEETEKLTFLLLSGLFVGWAWNVWDALPYFAIILAICFLYNKKLWIFPLFFLMILIGALPRLIIDQIFFGFAFYSAIKHFFALISFSLHGGIYNQLSHTSFLYFSFIISVLILVPYFIFTFYNKKIFFQYKKTILFLTFSLIMIVFNNSEIRYLLLVYPIIILMLGKTLTSKQFRSQAIIFFILSLVVINPYLIQIKYETNLWDLSQAITKFPNYTYNPVFKEDIIKEDINLIVKEYPYQTFVVGNRFDDYNIPAELYWGEKVKEFISIQDYQLFMKNESSIFKQTICSKSKGWWRRDLCFTIDLRKTINDQTDYSSIRYAISLDKTLDLENFELIKEYEILTLYKKLL